MITYIGLSFIIIGWGIQFLSKGKDIKKGFLLSYSLGALLLVIDGFLGNLTILAVFNLLSFVVALGVLWKIRE